MHAANQLRMQRHEELFCFVLRDTSYFARSSSPHELFRTSRPGISNGRLSLSPGVAGRGPDAAGCRSRRKSGACPAGDVATSCWANISHQFDWRATCSDHIRKRAFANVDSMVSERVGWHLLRFVVLRKGTHRISKQIT